MMGARGKMKRVWEKFRFWGMPSPKQTKSHERTMEEAQYQNLLSTHRTLMGWRHDYQNHLSVIKGMLASNDIQAAKAYVDDLTREAVENVIFVDSGNIAVDSVLNSKLPRAIENNIHVSLKLEVPEFNVSQIDLCTILGNLWDNAIEANQAIEDENARFIKFVIRPSEFLCSIHIENAVAESRYRQVISLESTKKEAGHGIGVAQIKAIVQKYEGVYLFKLNSGNVFVVDVLLPCELDETVEKIYLWDSASPLQD